MSLVHLDPYVHGAGPLHRADPRLKLLAMLAYVVLASALPPRAWGAYAGLLAMAVASLIATRLPLVSVTRRAAPALALSALVALGTIWSAEGDPNWSQRLLWLRLAIGEESLAHAGHVLVRAWLAAWIVGLYIAVTPFDATLRALRWLRLPAVLVTTLAFVYRYLFVLVEEALRLERARQSRTLRAPSLRRFGREARALGGMAGSLFLRALARSERVYQAMLSRGFGGAFSGLRRLRWQRADTIAAGVWGTLLLLIALSTAA